MRPRRGSFSSESLEGSDESLKDSDDSFGCKKGDNSFENDYEMVGKQHNGRSFGRSGSFKEDNCEEGAAGSPDGYKP